MGDLKPARTNCGCCSGINVETPVRVYNPPQQPAILYRIGSHSLFKESLLARLSSSSYPALSSLKTRDDSDFSIAFLDALATSLDVLTFYQERLANEHYLRTAIEKRSVQEMAYLIGYTPAPGVAASTYLAFKLQEAPQDPALSAGPITIPVGTRVQSIPGQDEEAQTFETIEKAAARTDWNDIAPQLTIPWRPVLHDTDLYLQGVATQLEPGDALLVVGKHRYTDTGSERWDVRVLESVEPDMDNDRTRVSWTDPLGHVNPDIEPADEKVRVFVFRQRAALFGHNAPDPRFLDGIGSWDFLIHGTPINLDIAYPKITAGSWVALVSNDQTRGSESLPGYVELYRVKKLAEASRTEFGLSGRLTRIWPDDDENLTEEFNIQDTLVLAQSEELMTVDRPLLYPLYGDEIALQGLVEGLEPDRPLAIRGKRQRIAVASGVNELEFHPDDEDPESLVEEDSLVLLEAPVELQAGTSVYLHPESFGDLIGDPAVVFEFRVQDRDGRNGFLRTHGDQVVLQDSFENDPETAEIIFIASGSDALADDRDRTTLKLKQALNSCYHRASVNISANVARATHGESVEEILGGGDASQTDQTFSLLQSPLTQVSAGTATGRASTLSLRVNDIEWTEKSTLYGQGGDERVFTVAQDDVGTSTVRFGDGVEGARLPSGQNNIRATYRKGLGTAGNVDASRITNLLTRPLGVSGATNPEPASGGEDAETLAAARQNAPLTVLTLDRAVSIQDYRNFARSFAGIDKAHAVWIPAGPARGVFLTVAGIDGAQVTAGSDTYNNLLAALKQFGDPLMTVTLVNHEPVVFSTRLAVKVLAEYDAETALVQVEKALRDHFGFDQRDFGQGVSLDEVMAVAHSIDGVEAVHVSELYRPDTGAPLTPETRLFAALPMASLTEIPDAAELLTLDPEPMDLEELP